VSSVPPKLHRGRFLADGIWLPPGFSGQDLLAAWIDGSQTLESLGGCLVRFLQPVRINAADCSGVPLVNSQGVLSSHPLAESAPKESDLCLWWQGSLHWGRVSALPNYPVHRLIQVQVTVQVAPVPAVVHTPKGAVAADAPNDLVQVEPPKELKKPERSWADVPDMNPMLTKALEQARSRAQQVQSTKSSRPSKAQTAAGGGGWIERIAESGLTNSIANLVSRGQQFMTSWLRSAQDDYLKRMMQHFEDGNWAEALRYGIPLGGEESQVLMEYMGLLKPRNQLNVTGGGGAVGAGIGMEGARVDRLRLLYEKAFQDLSRQGRHVEAAFVLAELFHDSHRAVLYLEEHQLFREASDLAELRKLSPELRVRLLFKSGQQQAALDLARREGVFEQVYQYLKHKPELAESWLKLWCQDLRQRGQVAQALLLSWSQNLEPEELDQHLLEALQEGTYQSGQVLAECLLRDLSILDDPTLESQLNEWEDSLDMVADAYQGFAQNLTQRRPASLASARYRTVCSRVCRKLLSKIDDGLNLLPSSNLRALAAAGEDRWLEADLPSKLVASDPSNLGLGLNCWTETIERLGFNALRHSALLPDGRSLVALGEAGLLLLNRRGKVLQRLEVPVDQIVLPTEGQRYLLVSNRGPYQLLHWFFPASLKFERWCSTKLEAWSQCHDGLNWWVATEGALYSADVNSAAWRTTGSFPVEAATRIERLVYRDGHTRGSGEVGLFLLFQDAAHQLQLQSHKLPSLDRVRQPFGLSQPHIYQSQQVMIECEDCRPQKITRPAVDLSIKLDLPDLFYKPWNADAHSFHQSYSALQFPHSQGVVVCILEWSSRRQLACFNFVGSEWISWQWQLERLLLTDDRGRFFVANLRQQWWDCNSCL
jgi:hypothetical protein